VSLENGTDSGVVQEGLAWNLHRMASGSYGYQAAFASWVQLRINGQLIGVYVNAEQRDKQMLRNRGLWTADETWISIRTTLAYPKSRTAMDLVQQMVRRQTSSIACVHGLRHAT
jgi:hypothetical protein